jgi:putative oxidoreductase
MNNFGRNQRKELGFNLATLLLRLAFGGLMLSHGFAKVARYGELSEKFIDFMGLGSEVSLILTIAAELGCAILLILGLFTRYASIPLIITMLVAAFLVHGGDPLADKEMALLYLSGYFSLLLLGSGQFSLDSLVIKNKRR